MTESVEEKELQALVLTRQISSQSVSLNILDGIVTDNSTYFDNAVLLREERKSSDASKKLEERRLSNFEPHRTHCWRERTEIEHQKEH